MKTKLTVVIDQINCPVQKDEELYIFQEVEKLVKTMGMKVKAIYFG